MIKSPENQEIIDRLKSLLSRAESGTMYSFAYAYIGDEGKESGWAGIGNGVSSLSEDLDIDLLISLLAQLRIRTGA